MIDDDKKQPGGIGKGAATSADKGERLAAALRRNLAKRKAQGRARRAEDTGKAASPSPKREHGPDPDD